MSVAIKTSFWVVTFGTIGFALFKLVKPDDELLSKLDAESKYTDVRQRTKQTIDVLKEAANPNSDINKKIEELLKK